MHKSMLQENLADHGGKIENSSRVTEDPGVQTDKPAKEYFSLCPMIMSVN
jgi:hypothetical protein